MATYNVHFFANKNVQFLATCMYVF